MARINMVISVLGTVVDIFRGINPELENELRERENYFSEHSDEYHDYLRSGMEFEAWRSAHA